MLNRKSEVAGIKGGVPGETKKRLGQGEAGKYRGKAIEIGKKQNRKERD